MDEEAEKAKAEKAAKCKAEREAAAKAAKEKAERERAAAKEACKKRKEKLEAAAKAAAEAAEEEKAAAEAAAAQAAKEEQEFTLLLSDIAAFGVPDADKRGGSDPYARFTLLNGSEGDGAATARTQPLYNVVDPAWTGGCSLLLPAGSEAAMEKAPKLKVMVFDKDLTTADDALGEAEVSLADAAAGAIDKLALAGKNGHADFAISFKYALSEAVAPAATLTLTAIKASGVPDKDATGHTSDPYLSFKLREVGDLVECAATPAQPNTEAPDWGELAITLELPRGSARPPLLTVRLWDDDVHDDDDALAQQDVRLALGEGGAAAPQEVTLTGRKGVCKEVPMSFTATLVEDKEDE